mmetsp:Transcript_5175/g.8165  ORF Transcript_5175/g.8165 Transcript_5175/m.8165 type:complete len:814 (-) Transcript_5175:286-2727(-)
MISMHQDGADPFVGKVIDFAGAGEEDSLWGGHQDDFSVSVCPRQTPPTKLSKSKAVPLTKIEVVAETTTPSTHRRTLMASTLKIPSKSSPSFPGKTSNRASITSSWHGDREEEEQQQPQQRSNQQYRRGRRKEQSLPEPSEDAWQLEDFPSRPSSGKVLSKSAQQTMNLPNASDQRKGSWSEFEDFSRPDNSQEGFAVLSSRFNKSLGDIPSADLDDLMKTPGDVLISLEKNKKDTPEKRGKEKTSLFPVDGPPLLDGITTNVINAESQEKRPSRSGKNPNRRRRDRGAVKSDRARVNENDKPSKSTDRTSRRERTTRPTSSRSVERSKLGETKDDNSKSARGERTTRPGSSRSVERSTRAERKGRVDKKDDNKTRIEDRSRKERVSRRSRSKGPGSPKDKSSPDVKKSPGKLSRRDRSLDNSRSSPGRSKSPGALNRRRRGRRSAPQRSASDDLLNLFSSSVEDLKELGVSTDFLEDFGMSPSQKEAEKYLRKRRLPDRAKSMVEVSRVDLGHGLSEIDRKSAIQPQERSEEKSPSGKSGGSKPSIQTFLTRSPSNTSSGSKPSLQNSYTRSPGNTSYGSKPSIQNSFKRSPGSTSTGSKPSIKSNPEFKTFIEENERLVKEANLAREQRLAEEAKLRRLQEEARLMEEKRLAEEARLKALQEEAKILEAKRREGEARLKAEARAAEEKRKAEDKRRQEELEAARNELKEKEARLLAESKLAEERRKVEEIKQKEELEIARNQWKEEENKRRKSTSLSEHISPTKKVEDTSPRRAVSVSDPPSRFRRPSTEDIPLPPAFQLYQQQNKRAQKK